MLIIAPSNFQIHIIGSGIALDAGAAACRIRNAANYTASMALHLALFSGNISLP